MNKDALIAKVAELTESTKKDAKVAVEAVLEAIVDGLVEDGEVSISGFGKFTAKEVAASTKRNPRTGEEVQVAAHRKPKFSAGKALKESVR
jgi:DNA-binding protein HU-beta